MVLAKLQAAAVGLLLLEPVCGRRLGHRPSDADA